MRRKTAGCVPVRRSDDGEKWELLFIESRRQKGEWHFPRVAVRRDEGWRAAAERGTLEGGGVEGRLREPRLEEWEWDQRPPSGSRRRGRKRRRSRKRGKRRRSRHRRRFDDSLSSSSSSSYSSSSESDSESDSDSGDDYGDDDAADDRYRRHYEKKNRKKGGAVVAVTQTQRMWLLFVDITHSRDSIPWAERHVRKRLWVNIDDAPKVAEKIADKGRRKRHEQALKKARKMLDKAELDASGDIVIP